MIIIILFQCVSVSVRVDISFSYVFFHSFIVASSAQSKAVVSTIMEHLQEDGKEEQKLKLKHSTEIRIYCY